MIQRFLILLICLSTFWRSTSAQNYHYDAANRLIQISSSDCTGAIYTYDANGNRLSIKQVSIATTSSVINEKCGNDGQIKIVPKDPSIKYRYQWSNGQTRASITNLASGNYSVIITDPSTGFTCDQVFTVRGTFKDSLAVIPHQIICNGANNGSAKLKVVTPDTIGSYLYHWSTSTDTAYTTIDSISNLKPGNYSVAIRNTARGCIRTINFSITEPPPLITDIIQTDASCPNSNDGTIKVNVDGDYSNYSFACTGPISGTLRSYQMTGLPAGKYMLTVIQNATNCSITKSITIGMKLSKATITASDPTTFFTGDDAMLSANTGPGYSYQWAKDGTDIPGATDSVYAARTDGSYTVRITLNECSLTSDPAKVIVLPTNNFAVSETDATCTTSNNGSIDVTASLSLKYTATITGTDGNTISKPFTTSLHIPNLSADTYSVCIGVDSQKTYKQCYTVVVNQPKDLSVYNVTINNLSKTVTMSLAGGKTYTVELNGRTFTTSDSTLTLPVTTGTNHLRITADQLCQGVYERTFLLSDGIIVFPNPFDRTLSVSLGLNRSQRIGVKVFNAVGTLVYSNIETNQGGFITIKLPDLIEGAYTLELSISNQLFKIIRK